jgi:hypothetical protein
MLFLITMTALLVPVFAALVDAQNNGPAQAIANPAQLAQGKTLTLYVSGFTPNTQLTIMLDNVKVSLWSDYANGQGSLDKQVTIPLSFSDGTHRIVVTDTYDNRAQTDITVQGNHVSAGIQLQPNSGMPGVSVAITGSNWQRNQKTVVLQGPDGRTLDLPASDLCVVQDCASGTLHLDVEIPAGATAGLSSVIVSDGIIQASATLNVLSLVNPSPSAKPGLVLQPSNGPAQSYVTINGAGFSSNAGLWVEWDGSQIDPQQALMRTNPQGVFSGLIIQVPLGAAAGVHTVLVTDGITSRARATFTVSAQSVVPVPVVNPPVQVNPPSPAAGGCNPNVPMYAQSGCAGGNSGVTPAPVLGPGPAPPPTPATGGCNPNIPMYAQSGCAGGNSGVTPAPVPGPGPAPPPTPATGGCNPNVPMYAQSGCGGGQQQPTAQSAAPRQPIARQTSTSASAKTAPQPNSSSGSTSAPARTAKPCKPNVPKYAQPGCVS